MASDSFTFTTITSRELDSGLEQFIRNIRGSGIDEDVGAALIKSLPSSRLRKLPPQGQATKPPIQITTHHSSPHASSPGMFHITSKDDQSTIHWAHQLESSSVSQNHVSLTRFIDHLKSSDPFGEQSIDLKSTYQGLRQSLGISPFPVSASDNNFRSTCLEANAPHLTKSQINIASGSSPITVRHSFANLTTIVFHHLGQPRYWIVVPPTEKAAFERRVKAEFPDSFTTEHCSQAIRHLSLWIEPFTLRQWGIKFHEIYQQAHQLLLLFPHAYYWGFSQGFSIIENKLFAGSCWEYTEYKFCSASSSLCVDAVEESLTVRLPPTLQTPVASQQNVTKTRASKRKAVEADLSNIRKTSRSEKKTIFAPISPKAVRYSSELPGDIDPALNGQSPTTGTLDTLSPKPQVPSTISSRNISYDSFDISDDEDLSLVPQDNERRVAKLQEEKAAILIELSKMKSERDQLSNRKSMYKSRLLEREEHIKSLEQEIRRSKQSIWQEVKQFAESHIKL